MGFVRKADYLNVLLQNEGVPGAEGCAEDALGELGASYLGEVRGSHMQLRHQHAPSFLPTHCTDEADTAASPTLDINPLFLNLLPQLGILVGMVAWVKKVSLVLSRKKNQYMGPGVIFFQKEKI